MKSISQEVSTTLRKENAEPICRGLGKCRPTSKPRTLTALFSPHILRKLSDQAGKYSSIHCHHSRHGSISSENQNNVTLQL